MGCLAALRIPAVFSGKREGVLFTKDSVRRGYENARENVVNTVLEEVREPRGCEVDETHGDSVGGV